MANERSIDKNLVNVNFKHSDMDASAGDYFSSSMSNALNKNIGAGLNKSREIDYANTGWSQASATDIYNNEYYNAFTWHEDKYARKEEPPKRLSIEEQQAIIDKRNLTGLIKPKREYSAKGLDLITEAKEKELRAISYADRTQGISKVAGFGLEIVAGIADPIELAVNFIPVVGQVRKAKMLAGAVSKGGRLAARLKIGAVEGLVGNAAIEPMRLYHAKNQQAFYTGMDALFNVVAGAAFGAGMHGVFGTLGEALAKKANTQAMDFNRPGSAALAEMTELRKAGKDISFLQEDLQLKQGFLKELDIHIATGKQSDNLDMLLNTHIDVPFQKKVNEMFKGLLTRTDRQNLYNYQRLTPQERFFLDKTAVSHILQDKDFDGVSFAAMAGDSIKIERYIQENDAFKKKQIASTEKLVQEEKAKAGINRQQQTGIVKAEKSKSAESEALTFHEQKYEQALLQAKEFAPEEASRSQVNMEAVVKDFNGTKLKREQRQQVMEYFNNCEALLHG